jgi:hypothetical protein
LLVYCFYVLVLIGRTSVLMEIAGRHYKNKGN